MCIERMEATFAVSVQRARRRSKRNRETGAYYDAHAQMRMHFAQFSRCKREAKHTHNARAQPLMGIKTTHVYKHPLFVTTAVCRLPHAMSTIVSPTSVSTLRGVECPHSFPWPSLPYIPPPQV